MTLQVADTSYLERIYYDASHWNRLRRHADREQIVRSFNRKKRAVFPSVVNAAELLNTPDPDGRGDLCSLMSAFMDGKHTILDHPSRVLETAVEARRKKDSTLVLTESRVASIFRRWVESPAGLDENIQKEINGWTTAMKDDNAEFRIELGKILGEKRFAGEATGLIRHEDFVKLLFEKVPEVAEIVKSPEEVLDLITHTAVWAWYAGAIAYEFHLQTRDFSKKEKKKLPGGPDMRQLAYLGLVNRFIARDDGLLTAARWIATQLPDEQRPDVLASDDYFSRTGYPFREGASSSSGFRLPLGTPSEGGP